MTLSSENLLEPKPTPEGDELMRAQITGADPEIYERRGFNPKVHHLLIFSISKQNLQTNRRVPAPKSLPLNSPLDQKSKCPLHS